MTDSKQVAPVRIAGICGSLNPEGKTRAALAKALEGAAEYNNDAALAGELKEKC
jgi:hypothetical protein